MLDGETDALASSANFVALLHSQMEDINWLGLYIARDDDLVLGPFQGQPACVRIPFGKGVCGTAYQEACTLRIDDVHQFDGHIVCDAASKSEIVIPLIHSGHVFAVLDVDSPLPSRFNQDDQEGLEKLSQHFVAHLAATHADLRGFI